MIVVVLAEVPGRTDVIALHRADGATPGGRAQVDVAEVDVVPAADLPAAVARLEREHDDLIWAWDDTARRYPQLLAAGVRVRRCHDLRLCHTILRTSAHTARSALALAPPGPWDAVPSGDEGDLLSLLPLTGDRAADAAQDGHAAGDADPVAELRRQVEAVDGSAHAGRLRLLLAAESTGALLAAEMHHDGLPWDVATHDALLTDLLGPRVPAGRRPELLERLADDVRSALDRPRLNPDSPVELLAALRAAGLDVESTRRHEIRALTHPVVEPLLEYKKRARLLSANGWAWMDAWVRDGRYRPDYVPGGVVTGRWASSGGGALQLPAAVRAAVRADDGRRLVVADAAQLEPRVLAAMSGDAAMAQAAQGKDLYQGIVDAGIVATRTEAKYAMLGAIYGATSGAAAVLMPQLTRAYPRAVGLVEAAARAGERGEVVTTWLGRSSPVPGERWWADVRAASQEGARPEESRLAGRRRRDWGRFTRNFVVQGTAAEWALCWLAALRRRLRTMPGGTDGTDGSGPHLVFFLHDEVVVDTPQALADDVAAAVTEAAAEAGRLLFGTAPVDFALDVAVVDAYDQAG